MRSYVFPVSQAPFSSAGSKLHVQIPMNSMSNGFEESFRLEKPLRPLGPACCKVFAQETPEMGTKRSTPFEE